MNTPNQQSMQSNALRDPSSMAPLQKGMSRRNSDLTTSTLSTWNEDSALFEVEKSKLMMTAISREIAESLIIEIGQEELQDKTNDSGSYYDRLKPDGNLRGLLRETLDQISDGSNDGEEQDEDLSSVCHLTGSTRELSIDVWDDDLWGGDRSENSSKESFTDSSASGSSTMRDILAVLPNIPSDLEASEEDQEDDSGIVQHFEKVADASPLPETTRIPRTNKSAIYPLKKKSVERSVSFTEVEVRHYERILCDTPSSTGGPSIGLGWKYIKREPISVDKFESKRRRRRQMVISREKREAFVRQLGYSEKEIAEAVREVNKIRNKRKQTVMGLGTCKMEEAVEGARRQLSRMLFRKKNKVSTLSK